MMLKETAAGFECGLSIEKFNDVKRRRYHWKLMLWRKLNLNKYSYKK